MRSALPFLVALALGGAASVLVACGDRSNLIPREDASRLEARIAAVENAIRDGECTLAEREATALSASARLLPDEVDLRLRRRVRQGADKLAEEVPEDCSAKTQPETTPETVPEVTTTVPTPETTPETTPPETTPETTPPETTPETVPPETVPPDGTGGTSPDDEGDEDGRDAVMPGGDPVAIAGRYELGERLGLGGMSTVQTAFDRRLERHVAVKLLAEHLAHDAQFISRFRREALAAARLVHPNIVQVFDFGLDEQTGRHYIVMERISGLSCAEILRERGRLPPAEVLDIVEQACSGLDYAHRNGVVHRDVKPGNLLLSDDSLVKVADFGIAKNLADESSLTQIGSVLGTAAYLAPEQAAGEEAGPRADLYALGVVTYQLLSGRLPYEAQSLTELALKQQREAPPLLHKVVDGVPEQLAAAVDRALALDPRDRFESAQLMAEALTLGAQGIGETTAATQLLAPHDPTDATSVLAPSTAARAPAPVRAREPRAPRHAPAPAHRPAASVPAPAPARQARRRRPGRLRRALGRLVLLALLAGGAAAAYITTSDDKAAVSLKDAVHEDAAEVARKLHDLIRDNTR